VGTVMLEGNAWRYGANVDTDVIIPARYLTLTDERDLAAHCLVDLDPDFRSRMQPGDIIVAEDNFGSGSSREHAPLAIKGTGTSCVIASSFARIFYRNAINVGLPILECPGAVADIRTGDRLRVDLENGTVENLRSETVFQAAPFPDSMRELIELGGLVPYVRSRLKSRS
jgi:3-isopropylmalate/(R)-2-methylmalate dehydratase small subunit